MANYAKQFARKKAKLSLTQFENFEDLGHNFVTKKKFCEKKYKSNKC